MKQNIIIAIFISFIILPAHSNMKDDYALQSAFRHSFDGIKFEIEWQLSGLEKIKSGKLVKINGNIAQKLNEIIAEGNDILDEMSLEKSIFLLENKVSELQYRVMNLRSEIRLIADRLAEDNGFRYWKELIDKAAISDRNTDSNAPTGTLQGCITGSDTGLPLQDVYVRLWNICYVLVDSMYTGPGGLYQFPGMDDGYYYLEIDPEPNGMGYIFEIFNNVYSMEDANWIRILDGYTQTLDIELDQGGSVSGHYENTFATPIADIKVYAEHLGSYKACYAVTDGAGNYEIVGLPTGEYTIWSIDTFDPADYPVVGYPDGPDYFQCLPVSVTAPNETSGIDFTVRRGVYIFGYVNDTDSGLPLEDAEIALVSNAGLIMKYTRSEADGRYTLMPVAPGKYYIRVSSHSGHIRESYDNHYQENCYDLVEVTPSDTVVGPFNFDLEMGGKINGTVTDKTSGLPVDNAEIILRDDMNRSMSYAYSEADGSYEFARLPSGTYYSSVRDFEYCMEYYDDKDRFETADPIVVTAPHTVNNIDYEIETCGEGIIQGTVIDSDGVPLARSYIDVFDIHGNYIRYGLVECDGSYDIQKLPTGDYYVFADAYYTNNECVWYGGASRMLDSTLVHVESPNTTANINFDLSPGTQITGVTLEYGSGYLTRPVVFAFNNEWDIESFTGTMIIRSFYRVRGLSAGSYYIEARDLIFMTHARKYYNNKTSQDTADLLTVTGPGTIGNIDFYLKRSGFIHGTAWDEMLAQGITRPAEAVLYNTGGQEIERSDVGRNGHFTINNPAGEDHYLRIESQAFINEYYGESTTMGGATVVNVGASEMLYDMDITLTPNPIWMELAYSPLIAGDILTVDMYLANSGAERNIDMYMAMMIESAIYYISLDQYGNWTVSETLSALSFPLPASAYYGPIPVFDFQLPADSPLPELTVTWMAVLVDSNSGQMWGDFYMEDMELWPSP